MLRPSSVRRTLAAVALLAAAAPAHAQRAERARWPVPDSAPPRPARAAGRRATPPAGRPPVNLGVTAIQTLAGVGGGLAGAFVGFLPVAARSLGGQSPRTDAAIVPVILGYYAGTVAGVQLSGRSMGMHGSWKATALGAAAGVLGGPAVVFTMPLGATIGYQRSRDR